MSAHKCEGSVWGLGWSNPCGNNAAHEHEGHWFCKTHHPPTVAAKNKVRRDKWQADWDAVKAKNEAKAAAQAEQKRRADCYPDLLAALIAAYEYVPPSSPVYQSLADAINKAVQP